MLEVIAAAVEASAIVEFESDCQTFATVGLFLQAVTVEQGEF